MCDGDARVLGATDDLPWGMTDLRETVVLVVGASGGLGSRIAARLERQGATVVRGGRDASRLSGAGAYLADLRDPVGGPSLVAAALHQHGRLDGVVIASGVVAFGPVAALGDDALDEVFETNVLGPIRLIRAAVPFLEQSTRHPFVVTISGVVADAPMAGLAAYSAAKSALAAFAVAAGRELRRSGIRMLDARPGHTETSLAAHAIEGTAPAFGAGLDPDAVADRIVRAILDGEKDLPADAFTP